MSGYAGDLGPRQAWELLTAERDARLVDVRTAAEWSYVGVPDLGTAGKEPLLVEWQRFPSGEVDPGFVDRIEAAGVPRTAPILLLCRSGVRSLAAARALTERGYTRAYNIAGGFEGPVDPDRHRGTLAGWKFEGLPWKQQ